jgi:ketosteroid isomerase-like protein
MKILLPVALVGLAISFTVPTLAQQKDTVDPKIDQQIRALAMKYDEAYNRQDPAAVAALYTEDAVLQSPHGPFRGRQAIEKIMQDTISRTTILKTCSLMSIA